MIILTTHTKDLCLIAGPDLLVWGVESLIGYPNVKLLGYIIPGQ